MSRLEPFEEVVDFGTCGGCKVGCRAPLGVAVQHPATHQHVLAHREPHAGLLLVAQQRQVGVEEVVGLVAPPGCSDAVP